MKVLCREDLANHSDPESCAVTRKGGREALTGADAGRTLSSETKLDQDADALRGVGRQHQIHRLREVCLGPAESSTSCTHRSLLRGSREIPCLASSDGDEVRLGNPQGVILR